MRCGAFRHRSARAGAFRNRPFHARPRHERQQTAHSSVRAERAGTLELSDRGNARNPERREGGGQADALGPTRLEPDRLDVPHRRLHGPHEFLRPIDRVHADGSIRRPRLEPRSILQDYRPSGRTRRLQHERGAAGGLPSAARRAPSPRNPDKPGRHRSGA